jgi:homocysteine S-methyltransferase
VGDRKIYLSSPDYMANYAVRMIGAGARFVGGCCGTTEDHIKRIRDEVATMQPRQAHPVVARRAVVAPEGIETVTLARRSTLGAKLAGDAFVLNVELPPARGWRSDVLLAQARALQELGVDCVSVLDGARARSAIAAIPAALVIEHETGLETMVHYTCRDRNMLGMLSDMLGAAAAGLRNVLLITGDPPRFGPYPESTAVFDIDSIGLTNVVYRLNHGLDPGGNPIGEPTRFVVGVAANHMAVDMGRELKRLYWKVDAGADFIVTQPVFDVGPFDAFLRSTEEFGLPVLAGVWPLTSVRNAEFLANEVPGQRVPPAVLARMRTAQERGADAALEEGILIAREIVQALRGMVRGVHLSLPRGRSEVARAVLFDA